MDETACIEITRRWISDMVIGLNLCPFARRVFDGNGIRYVVTRASGADELRKVLIAELEYLAARDSSEVETTLVIHPEALRNFLDYNDFLGAADRLLRKMKLDDTVQLASFHPDYEFTDALPGAVENYTNRSPFPMLHLLRVETVAKVSGDEARMREIPERNIETLRTLGRDEVLRMLDAVRGGCVGLNLDPPATPNAGGDYEP